MVNLYPGEDAFLGSHEIGNYAQFRFSSWKGFLLPPHPQVISPVSRKRKVSFFRGAGWVEVLRFLTCNVHEPRHAKFVSEHAKRITPWGFLQWHCYGAAGRKLLEIAL